MYWMGIDLGGTNIVAGLVDETRTIVDRVSVKTRVPRPMEEMADDMADMVRALLARNGLNMGDLPFVGVGVPCTANEETGHMEDANNLGFDDVAFVPLLEERLGLPVRIGNDANAAAWGEFVAGDYPEGSMLMVTLGTGIGGGIILNRKLWSGYNFAAGEFGHMTLCMDGVPCTCGRRGCFEAYASATALIRMTRAAMEKHPESAMHSIAAENGGVDGRTAFLAQQQGDAAGSAVVGEYVHYLSIGVANIVNIFFPEVVAVSGGVSNQGENLLAPLRQAVSQQEYGAAYTTRHPRILRCILGNDAGVIGAALFAEE